VSACILAFPKRSPFSVAVIPDDRDGLWWVICRSHAWVFSDQQEALRDATAVASGFGVAIEVKSKANLSAGIWRAAIATVWEAGPLPDHIEDAPAHFANWCRLMRRHDLHLQTLTDADIHKMLDEEE
jgi:hypothetical protein